MQRTIWKYPIQLKDTFSIEMPSDSKILHVDTQMYAPYIWVEVPANQDHQVSTVIRLFYLLGTGTTGLDLTNLVYVGTFMIEHEKLVFHLYVREDF